MRSLLSKMLIPIAFSACRGPVFSDGFSIRLPQVQQNSKAMRTLASFPHSIHHHSIGMTLLFDQGRPLLSRTRTIGLPASISSEDDKDNINKSEPDDVKKNVAVEIAGVAVWMAVLSSFLLLNNFDGPWPTGMENWFPFPVWMLLHALSGMLFSGGIILTTLIEWLVVSAASKPNKRREGLSILEFWFEKVPMLDMAVVLPALTMAIFSGTGLATCNYGSLGAAPLHVKASLHTLVTFAIWWGATDLTTQGPARSVLMSKEQDKNKETGTPNILALRRISNAVSCMFVVVLYGIMIVKPGF